MGNTGRLKWLFIVPIVLVVLTIPLAIFAGFFSNKSLKTGSTTMVTTDSIEDWKTYTNSEIGLSINFPNNWSLQELTDQEKIDGIEIQGKQGDLRLVWGSGLGGGCNQSYEKIQIKDEQLDTCHSINSDNSEVWGQINKLLKDTAFSGMATAYAPRQGNRDVILKILSTLKFTP